jgi:hypothetical protein
MDVLKMIQDLLDERDRIDATIAKLEALRGPGGAAPRGSRRGRKAMSLSEREEVSRRMRNYWDQRRRLDGTPPVDSPPFAHDSAEEPVHNEEKSRKATSGK